MFVQNLLLVSDSNSLNLKKIEENTKRIGEITLPQPSTQNIRTSFRVFWFDRYLQKHSDKNRSSKKAKKSVQFAFAVINRKL